MGRYDVVIVGSGPAGAAAAITATRQRLRAVVVDKAHFPRDKTCGDGLTTNALRLLESLGVSLEDLQGPGGYVHVDDAMLVGPDGRTIVLPLPRRRGEYAGVVSRMCLDETLHDLVAATSAEQRLGVAVDFALPSSSGVEVHLDDGSTIDARYVIAADGHWSAVRRSLHPEAPRDLGEWHAARQYFSNAGDDRLWVVFEPDLLPGYVWVFPLPDGRANVGYGVLRNQGRSGKDLKALWPELLARPTVQRVLGPHATPEGAVRAWPIPTRYASASLVDAYSGGRVLYVGDAASVVDPMTGEGIAQAIETGMLASLAISRGGDVAASYRRSVHKTLGRDLQFAGLLQHVLARPRGARAALRVVDANNWTRRNFARWMFEDYPRAIAFTPDRWRPNPFRKSGAYRDSTPIVQS